ncbi:hypothetical protein [Jannaschia sp. 2305UL9-9]|uniref:hypothetical protein n=1 Tax=Jannaschia sp. 2305UL9-9 TaxID=3121638 RepID=UPI0035274B54
MRLQKLGGMAGLACAATYLFGFVVLVTLLAPLGFGTAGVDPRGVVAFIETDAALLILWNSVIYIVNALALTVLVLAIHARLRARTPDWADVTRALGLIWATLVIAAGMIANVAVERAASLAPTQFDRAVMLWETMHAVELGLGGGNEIAGGVWIGCVSLAGWIGRSLGRIVIGMGLLTGTSGMLTLVPVLGDVTGAVFGLGAIGWFVAIGLTLIRPRNVA